MPKPVCQVGDNRQDMPRIAKAKAQKKSSLGIAPPKQKILNRGFPTRDKPRIEKPAPLARRSIYTRQIIEGSR